MKTFLVGILALALLGGGYLLQKNQETIASLQDSLAQANKAKADAVQAGESLKADLEKAKNDIQALQDDQKATEPLKQQLDQLQKDFDAYKEKYRIQARNKAVGEKLDQLVTANATYQSVTIKAVDPASINIEHADGASRILFTDLGQDWRDRFDYDDAEAQSYLKEQADLALKIGTQVQVDYAAYQAAEAKAKADATNETNARIDGRISGYKNQIEALRNSLRSELGLHPTTSTSINGQSTTTYPPFFGDPEDDPQIGAPTAQMYNARSLRDQIDSLKSELARWNST